MSSSNQGDGGKPKPTFGEWLDQNGYSDFDDIGKEARPRATKPTAKISSVSRPVTPPASPVAPPDLTRLPYKEYLQSHHWWLVRQSALKRSNNRCQLCNSPKQLQVHHRTYERLGAERDDDVIVLCDTCHSRFHSTTNLYGKSQRPSQTHTYKKSNRGNRSYNTARAKKKSAGAIIAWIVFAVLGILIIVGVVNGKNTPATSPAATAIVDSDIAAPMTRNTCPAGFPIKGNLTTYNGDKIYHVPSGAYYSVTNPEECFSTEAAAQAHGYRRSRL